MGNVLRTSAMDNERLHVFAMNAFCGSGVFLALVSGGILMKHDPMLVPVSAC